MFFFKSLKDDLLLALNTLKILTHFFLPTRVFAAKKCLKFDFFLLLVNFEWVLLGAKTICCSGKLAQLLSFNLRYSVCCADLRSKNGEHRRKTGFGKNGRNRSKTGQIDQNWK